MKEYNANTPTHEIYHDPVDGTYNVVVPDPANPNSGTERSTSSR